MLPILDASVSSAHAAWCRCLREPSRRLVPRIAKLALVLAVMLPLGACSSPPMEVLLTRAHPANPRAAESPLPPPFTPLTSATAASRTPAAPPAPVAPAPPAGDAPPPAPAPSAPAPPAAPATMFTCPMHPEVRSPTAGRCPKCGMNLVPIPAAKPAPASDPAPASARARWPAHAAAIRGGDA
jgi:Heavy metal binding domain